jgi:hypothetical protein
MRGTIVAVINRKTDEEKSMGLDGGENKVASISSDNTEVTQKSSENAIEMKDINGDENAGKPNIATFRGIPKKLHDAIKQTAAGLGVSPGELARYLLEVGLERLETGEDAIEPKFVPGGFTLYPEEGSRQPKRRGRKKSKVLQQPRSYYGVPRDVVKAILDKSKEVGVTQGEVARRLLEKGLERYKAGELAITPAPLHQIATLYPEDLGKV